ncbi:MAG: hypothetical protein GYA85_09165 [Propionibacterium sp.]|nr:hypothetical protein [Propionibacterium sp.]
MTSTRSTHSTGWTTVGVVCLLLAPLLSMAADLARMQAEQSGALAGIVSETGSDQLAAMLAAIDANLGLYQVASWLALAAAVVAIPAVGAVRRLTVARSPRWSAAAFFTGICLVIGEFVHLMGYYAWNQMLVASPDRQAAVELGMQTEQNVFGLVVFAPYLIGVLLFWPFAGVALWRSRLIPVWSLGLVLAGAVVMIVAGSSFITSPVSAIATVVGLAPVLVARSRSARTSADPAVANASTPVVT